MSNYPEPCCEHCSHPVRWHKRPLDGSFLMRCLEWRCRCEYPVVAG